MKMERPQRLEMQDFTLGLLNAANEREPGFIMNPRNHLLDAAMADALEHLTFLIDTKEIPEMDVRFRIAPDAHGISDRVFNTMAFLYDLGFVAQIHPGSQYYRFNQEGGSKAAKAFHEERLTQHAGPFETYQRLAGRFVTILSGGVVEPLPTAS